MLLWPKFQKTLDKIHKNIDGEPDSITIINYNCVATNVPDRKQLSIVDTTTMCCISQIQIDEECRGLSYFNDDFLLLIIIRLVNAINHFGERLDIDNKMTGGLNLYIDNDSHLYSNEDSSKEITFVKKK